MGRIYNNEGDNYEHHNYNCWYLAFGKRCIQSGAEPYWFTVSTVAINGLWPDDVNEPGQSRVRKILHYLNRSEDIFKRDVYRSYHYMPIQTNL